MILHPRDSRGQADYVEYDLICSWFGLTPGTWPPDHHRLLGLEPGETNAAVIEQRVHERLEMVRCYQISHPEQATEAMNRLAQAFVCLLETASKHDARKQLVMLAPVNPVSAALAPSSVDALDWLYPVPALSAPARTTILDSSSTDTQPLPRTSGPPPLPSSRPKPPPLPSTFPSVAEETAVVQPVAPPVPAAPPTELIDPCQEAARCEAARRGLGTKRLLYRRIFRTRHLLRVWNELGRYLDKPNRRLKRSAEGPEFLRLLDEITELLQGFPALLGEAGHPGYLVLALTQMDTLKVFQSFSPHQREALTRDWQAGVKLLTAHRSFLHQEWRAMRRRSRRQRLLKVGRCLLVDHPGSLLLLLLAINVVLWFSYAVALWEKLISH